MRIKNWTAADKSNWPAESSDPRDLLDELKIELSLWPSEELEIVEVEQNKTAL